jgi:predicted Zn-dependent peptidase
VASRYASQLLLEKKLTTPAQTMREIDKVTAEDVQQVAADLFRSSRLNLALIGPYKNEEEFRKLLSL